MVPMYMYVFTSVDQQYVCIWDEVNIFELGVEP